ncbi:hypothetical protein ACQEUX_19500 [Micromonospora sp. CA-259024]
MNRGHVAVAVSMIVIGVTGLVAGVVAVFSGGGGDSGGGGGS